MTRPTSRRRFLKVAAATGAVAGLNVAVLAQDGGRSENVVLLGGYTPGWVNYRVSGAEANQNPTLALRAGETYTLMWQNVDGAPHNFAIQDAEGNNLEVLQPLAVEQNVFAEANQTSLDQSISLDVSDSNVTGVTVGNETPTGEEMAVPEGQLVGISEIVSEQGAVQAVRFTATEEMTQYICTVHPTTMVGDVTVETGDGSGENGGGY